MFCFWFCFSFLFKEFLLNDTCPTLSPIGSLVTDSHLFFLRVRSVKRKKKKSKECIVPRVTFTTDNVFPRFNWKLIIPSMTKILLEYIDRSLPIPSKVTVAFPR